MKEKIAKLSLMPGILVMLASCTQDDGLGSPIDADNGMVPVSFTAFMDNGMSTRATATTDDDISRCLLQIIDNGANGNESTKLDLLTDEDDTDGWTFNAMLNPTHQYTFLLWADNSTTAITDLEAVTYTDNTIAYAKMEPWVYDAMTPNTVISVQLQHIVTKVTLKTTTDLVAGSAIKVNVPKTYATYNVNGESTQTSVAPTANGYEHTITLTNGITADATNGTEVCSFYALVDNENQPIRITNGNNQGVYKVVTEVPIGPNKHIILLGDVANAGLTGVTFTASVDEQWGSTIPDLPFEKLDLTKGAITITEDGTYHITSNGATTTNAITVSGNISPKIYISDLNMTVSSGSAISITGGANATIFVMGENSVTSEEGAGVFVEQNATVTIMGRSRDDELTATGGGGGAGIGGYVISNNNGANCGNINISSVTVYSCGSISDVGDISAGIGSASGASCGTITIDNATVHAYGTSLVSTMYTPDIGRGVSVSGRQSDIPIVNISNQSEIHAHRGGVNADYIGGAGFHLNTTNGTINLGGGTCTDSTVYCYTGTSTTTDTVVEYDNNGNGTNTEN